MRFKDFDNNWKVYKIDDITKSCGGGTPSTKNELYWNGNIPWISSSDLFDNDIRSININRYITKDALLNSSTKLCPKGTICIVSRVGVGKIAISECEICTSQDFMNIIDFKGNKYFLAQLLQNKIKSSQLQGTSIKGITTKEIKDLRLFIPCMKEQDKIMQFLYIIDEKINTQIKIINDLEAQRKYIINRLLNKLNNNKFIQLSDILEEYSERTSSNNEFPVLSSTTSGLFFQTEYFNKDASSSDTTGYRIIPKGYCTYRSMSDTGHFTFNQQNIIDIGIISPAYPVFYSKKYMNEFIILYLNNSQDIKKQILELKTGGTRFALSFKTLISFKIPKVDTLTQKKTLKIINSISEKIDNENNIYNYLIKEKSYLLNNMFI